MADKPILYSIDDETKELLTEMLNLLEGLADLQMTDESTEEMRLLNRSVGERFGIEFRDIVLESDQDSDGNPRFTVMSYKEPNLRRDPSEYLRLVSNRDLEGASDGVPKNDNNDT